MFEIFGLLNDDEWFDCPEYELREIEVCAESGHRAGPNCANTVLELVPAAGLDTEACPYCMIVHCDSTLQWRVTSETESVADIRPEKWFVLPPAIEWYYKTRHSDYRALPPYKNGAVQTGTRSMSLIYPDSRSVVYVPLELDGKRGRVVFKAAHRNERTTIFWRIDERYLGSTKDIHQMALAPKPGPHIITLVDENGTRLQQVFTVLDKN